MTSNVEKPRCAGCGRKMPTFDNANLAIGAEPDGSGVQLAAITFHLVCTCGREWNLTKKVTKVVEN